MVEDFKILEEIENPLFNRKEIKGSIEAEVTPSHADVEKLICEKFSSQVEKIKIKKISGKFGSKTSIIIANIYGSKEDLEKIESKSKKEKQREETIKKETEENKPVEEKPKEEIGEEKSSEEQPKEETKPTEQKTDEIPEEPEKTN